MSEIDKDLLKEVQGKLSESESEGPENEEEATPLELISVDTERIADELKEIREILAEGLAILTIIASKKFEIDLTGEPDGTH